MNNLPPNSCTSQAGPRVSQRLWARHHPQGQVAFLYARPPTITREATAGCPQGEGDYAPSQRRAGCAPDPEEALGHLSPQSALTSYRQLSLSCDQEASRGFNWAKTDLVENKWPNIIWPQNKLIAVIICWRLSG